ncbi:hypothetical protein JVT61DRAFT_9884 [Boletus reticuloceps]|uniref:Uncharacterized protein n=1 Tax=Boletus reticuloceps TaxID=495285 RepID=A0A8I2YFF7_9AGAM|nr:hypothetical protein JVT61DRAFT_9884 [Boletus reticuloceps]
METTTSSTVDIFEKLSLLTMKEWMQFVRPVFRFVNEWQTKEKMIRQILMYAPSDLVWQMSLAGESKARAKRLQGRKRKRKQTCNLEQDLDSSEDDFMELPSAEEKKCCYTNFFNATSDNALQSQICSVCAQECGPMDEQIETVHLADLPNKSCLSPRYPHPVQKLIDGLLLEPNGCLATASGLQIRVC